MGISVLQIAPFLPLSLFARIAPLSLTIGVVSVLAVPLAPVALLAWYAMLRQGLGGWMFAIVLPAMIAAVAVMGIGMVSELRLGAYHPSALLHATVTALLGAAIRWATQWRRPDAVAPR